MTVLLSKCGRKPRPCHPLPRSEGASGGSSRSCIMRGLPDERVETSRLRGHPKSRRKNGGGTA